MGRKPVEVKDKRVTLNAMVHPRTLEALKAEAKARGVSQGIVIDMALVALRETVARYATLPAVLLEAVKQGKERAAEGWQSLDAVGGSETEIKLDGLVGHGIEGTSSVAYEDNTLVVPSAHLDAVAAPAMSKSVIRRHVAQRGIREKGDSKR